MIIVRLTRYIIDGSGVAEFSDGTTGEVDLTVNTDPRPSFQGTYLCGREDLIAAAVKDGAAEVHLADGGRIPITISPLFKRFALTKPVNARPMPIGIGPTMRHFLGIAGEAALILYAKTAGRVTLQQQLPTDGGSVPRQFEVDGEPGLMEAASHRKTVKIQFLGLTFRARVADYYEGSHTLVVDAEPLFRAMAEHVKAARRSRW